MCCWDEGCLFCRTTLLSVGDVVNGPLGELLRTLVSKRPRPQARSIIIVVVQESFSLTSSKRVHAYVQSFYCGGGSCGVLAMGRDKKNVILPTVVKRSSRAHGVNMVVPVDG
jgi:hypothetical protein